jgi:predicted RNA-binding Zn-ribbon protein involved in translation (DUF1610 family)
MTWVENIDGWKVGKLNMERSIYFICFCGKHLAVNEVGSGQEINCPDCGKTLIIPRADTEWVCSCGTPILISANLSVFGELSEPNFL